MEKAVTILGPMRFDRMSNIFCLALVLYSGTQNVLLLLLFCHILWLGTSQWESLASNSMGNATGGNHMGGNHVGGTGFSQGTPHCSHVIHLFCDEPMSHQPLNAFTSRMTIISQFLNKNFSSICIIMWLSTCSPQSTPQWPYWIIISRWTCVTPPFDVRAPDRFHNFLRCCEQKLRTQE